MQTVTFTLNGQPIVAQAGETILQAAQRTGTEIPHLCYKAGYRADGNCRACVVEIDGERTLAPSCCRQPKDGMSVSSNSERARHSQRLVIELLKSDMPPAERSPYSPSSELDHWAERLDIDRVRFASREQPPRIFLTRRSRLSSTPAFSAPAVSGPVAKNR